MAGAMRLITVVTVLCCAVVALATEADSLRGALEALDRRQRALQQRPAYQGARYHYPAQQLEQQDENDVEFLPLEPGQPEDIGYGYQRGGGRGQKHETHPTPAQLERLLLEYLQGNEGEDSRASDDDEKWSPFREKDSDSSAEVKRAPPASMFRERQRQDKRAAPGPGDERYMQLLAALWDKYQRELEEQQEAEEESMEKRQDGGYGYGYDFYNSPMGWGDGHFNGYKRSGAAENDPWFPAFELVPRERQAKRFPISKRSSGGAPLKKKGDKVAKDLAEIFEDKKKSNTSNNNSSTEAPTTVTTGTPHPAMHKKSVDWSQYFGIDRRRKKSAAPTESSSGEESAEEVAQRENEQRIMEQYYRTLALATTVKRKRSGDSESPAQTAQGEEPASLEGMDQKLKAMEDLIVDEAVKYTGAHQGTGDPQEIKSVKEQVLSRLAAAYSLEKMRQALDEFRSSLGPEEHEQGRGEKRSQGAECPELRALAASCHRIQPAFVEPCTWHHACQICSGEGEGECDAGFLQAASQVCEGHVTCLRGARRLLTVLSRSETGPARCEICLRRFLELRRR